MRKEKFKYIRHCLYCGDEFQAMRPQAKYCSNSHRAAYGIANKKEGFDKIELSIKNRIEEIFDGYAFPDETSFMENMLHTLKCINIDLLEDFMSIWKKGEKLEDYTFDIDVSDTQMVKLKEKKIAPAIKKAAEMKKRIDEME